jgi:hypothetical protein
MKVIIVEVTRAANSFGLTHLDKIREAYDGIRRIVEDGQRNGEFREQLSAQFAALAFYGAIEQVLTGWIFDLLPPDAKEFDHAKAYVIDTICGGLERPGPPRGGPGG